MEWSRLKNVIIVMLLLLNLLFLLPMGVTWSQEQESLRNVRSNALLFLEEQGIRLEQDMVPWQSKLHFYEISRDRYDERGFAQSILGEITSEHLGTTLQYYGDRGRVEISQGGIFAVQFSEGLSLQGGDREKTGIDFLKTIGIQSVLADQSQEKNVVSYWQTLEGLPVFHCEITLRYENDLLLEVEGRRMVSTPEPSSGNLRSPATLLIHLAQAKMDGLITLNEIQSIEEGYMNQGSVPVWRVRTDCGILYLDCSTGEIRIF